MKDCHSLLVAQLLLAQAGSRIKLKAVFGVAEGYFRFRVQGRRGISPKMTMPVIHRTEGTSVLALLDETNSKERSWLINGQASAGMKQVAHYGDCGRAWFKSSRAHLHEWYTKAAFYSDEEAAKLAAEAPETEVLVVRDQNDIPHEYALPSVPVADNLLLALLGNEPISVSGQEEHYRQQVETFRLGLKFGTGQLAGFMFSPAWVKDSQSSWLAARSAPAA